MMNNLFSIFDPSTSILNLNLNWLSSLLILSFFPPSYWLTPSKLSSFLTLLITSLKKELSTLLGPSHPTSSPLILITLFLFILINNVLGLTPYIFTASSHLSFALSIAVPLWLTAILYGWLQNTLHSLAHLVPQGTPTPLMMFMVCIETTSNFIRPITLSVRLTANMIAGHLLMTLLSNALANTNFMTYIILMPTQLMLIMLESAVAVIQAYVFTVLTTLYISESN
uniref:ATP synthase F0 subunit 6 n=1 Tax=Spirobolus walkeri TaxID=3058339 RepID=UPI0026E4783D|nr:ATP synthase F0 subunit 6 [Spirobolus walkeri]WJR82403.1 ATP synthase subunit 6 [Spirobolus walkeri]